MTDRPCGHGWHCDCCASVYRDAECTCGGERISVLQQRIRELEAVAEAARGQTEPYEATWCDDFRDVDPRLQALFNAVRVTYDALAALAPSTDTKPRDGHG